MNDNPQSDPMVHSSRMMLNRTDPPTAVTPVRAGGGSECQGDTLARRGGVCGPGAHLGITQDHGPAPRGGGPDLNPLESGVRLAGLRVLDHLLVEEGEPAHLAVQT